VNELTVQRFDYIELKATKTPEGFIQDSPIVGRVGILEYRQPDGSIRREFRPPEEAFHADRRGSLKGKPVTAGHFGLVRADNVSTIKPIGTILTEGTQDGDNIRADLIIYNLDTKGRQLSCGYTLDTEEAPGEWKGVSYQAIQRNIRYNHVAVVQSARAGPTARLNMDGNQYFDNGKGGEKQMPKIRLDGIEYEAAQEVINALEKANARIDTLETAGKAAQTNLDAVTAERDGLKAKVDGHADELDKANKDAADTIGAAIKARVELLRTAETFRVDKADELSDKEIKVSVIKAVRGDDFDPADKSDAYIDAAFDLAKADKRVDSMADQRKKLNDKGGKNNEDENSSSTSARQRMIEKQKSAYAGEKGGK